jgi:hypothetical protein
LKHIYLHGRRIKSKQIAVYGTIEEPTPPGSKFSLLPVNLGHSIKNIMRIVVA